MPTPFDYVDVATRLQEAFKKYPDLRIQEKQPVLVEAGTGLFVEVAVTSRSTVSVMESAVEPVTTTPSTT